jgi:hypothetical protein
MNTMNAQAPVLSSSMSTMVEHAENATKQHRQMQLQLQHLHVQHQHQMTELASQMGCISPQHDRYILHTLQLQQQQQHQHLLHNNSTQTLQQQQAIAIMPMPPLNNHQMNMNIMNLNAGRQEEELSHLQHMKNTEMHKKKLAALMHQVCDKDAPILPTPPLLVFAGNSIGYSADNTCSSTGMVEEADITSYDVLAGRGNRINNHVGNFMFRELVKPFKLLYLQQKSTIKSRKHIKGRMCAVLVNYVRTNFCPQGRFLERDPNTPNMWVEIGDEKARRKAGQALREDATEIRAELGITKPGAGVGPIASTATTSKTASTVTATASNKKEDDDEEVLPAATDATAAAYEEEQEQPHAHELNEEEAEAASEDYYLNPMPMPLNNNLPLLENLSSSPSTAVSNFKNHINMYKYFNGLPPATNDTGTGSSDRMALGSSCDYPAPIPSMMMTSRAAAMAVARSDFKSSSSMMSTATAVIGNLSTRNAHVNVNARANAKMIAEVYHQPGGIHEEEELILLKQKNRLLTCHRKHKPQPSLTTTTTDTSPEETTETVASGRISNGNNNGNGNYPNASDVPRLDLDVSNNRTIQEGLVCAQDNNTHDDDSDCDSLDIIDNIVAQEEQTSRLYSKTAAAAAAFGHESGSSSGSSYRRGPSQASASLRRSMKSHANASVSGHHTRSSTKQQGNSSICMHDLIMGIDDASKQNTKSMFDSSMTMSTADHFFGNSGTLLSSTNWNTSHGTMSLADFSFSQRLWHDLPDDCLFEDSDDEEDVQDHKARAAARRSAAGGSGSESLSHLDQSSGESSMSHSLLL